MLPRRLSWSRCWSGTNILIRESVIFQDRPLTPADGKQQVPLLLDLGQVRDVAVVRVNGQQAGTLWKAPYRVDISALVKAGENRLEVDIINQWNNRLVGDCQPAVSQRITRSNLAGKFSASSPLLPSGLLGPVTLRQGTHVKTPWR